MCEPASLVTWPMESTFDEKHYLEKRGEELERWLGGQEPSALTEDAEFGSQYPH